MCFCAAKRITDHIKDDALPSGTTHPTADRHDYLPGNPLRKTAGLVEAVKRGLMEPMTG
jgi:hypothetical protein